jgi:2-succinyl-5-enolpyruvyl-6-hydroxy-3-cyclohexene-1-carboxylate synthase
VVSSIKGVNELVVLCKMHGVKHVVISPGSRNAPLSITFENTNDIHTYVVVDERSAAFFALGISLATNTPVAIVCTSGSAALNYAPAVSEAYYQKIPLIVITADRPLEWVNQGDGQTIMQEGIYGKHILNSVSLPVIENEDTAWLYNRLVNESFIKANGNVKGPVHINVPFKEPLYKVQNSENIKIRQIQKYNSEHISNKSWSKEIVNVVANGKKVLFLAGQISDFRLANEISELLASKENMVVLSETTSNIRGKSVFSIIDRLIDGFTEKQKTDMAPDVLITFGGAVVSKKVKAWLRNAKPEKHIHIGFENNVLDTFQCLTHWVETSITSALNELLPLVIFKKDYFSEWTDIKNANIIKHQAYLSQADWSDLKAFEIIVNNLPACDLHLGNSSPIRYMQLFDMVEWVKYYSNRGTSGIDGSTSTALGFSCVSNELNIIISGDISFYYDSNALWNNYMKGNFKIILINNKGGNIFRIIDGPSDEEITKKYFEAQQEMNAEHLCLQFGLSYITVRNENELKNEIVEFLKITNKPGVLEIFTDNIISPQALKNYFNHLKS